MTRSDVRVGDWLMPEGGPVASSVRVLEVGDQGARFRRMCLSCEGEEFFLNWRSIETSSWRQVPSGLQLAFL